MEPENYTKENKNTLTNILLFLVLLVMVGILFFLVKNSKKTEISYTPDQEVIVNIPVEVEPNPTPVVPPVINPNPTPTPQNINLVVGQSYFTSFNTNSEYLKKMKYCGIQSYTIYGDISETGMFFAPMNSSACDNSETEGLSVSLKKFKVKLKSIHGIGRLNELNAEYGVAINSLYPNSESIVDLYVTTSNLNAYTLSKLYFDKGYFEWTSAEQGSTGSDSTFTPN